jgi:hypothetical protein
LDIHGRFRFKSNSLLSLQNNNNNCKLVVERGVLDG